LNPQYSGYPQGVPLQFSINNIFKKIIKQKINNNLIFILTDKTDFSEKELKILSQNNEIIIINIFDYFENNLSLEKKETNNFMNLSLNFVDNFININLSNSKKIEEYKKLRKNKIEKLKFSLRKNNI
jgi:hypothetical protein